MSRSRPLRRLVLPLAAFALAAASPASYTVRSARANAPVAHAAGPTVIRRADSLGIRDLLDIATTSVADLSADGQWLALTVTTRRDQLGAEAVRDGDPTYLRAVATRLLVVDTRSLAQRAVFTDKKAVRTATWSPDGSRLAILVVENDALQVLVWNRATGKSTSPRLPAGQYVAENSELRWTDDGAAFAFALRATAWKAKAKQRFDELTRGPVTVLDGTNDFLEWDAMNRLAAERVIVAWDVAKNTVTTLQPEGLIGQWTLAKDGSAITTQQDITRKTDYDIIGGREWKLVAQALGATPATGAAANVGAAIVGAAIAPRTIVATLKGAQIAWADDGKRFAITRDGRVSVASIADTALRQLLGPTGNARAGGTGLAGGAAPAPVAPAPPDTSAAARAQRAKERFSVSRWSPAGDALLATNSEGFWMVDVASGSKEMIVPLPDSNSSEPRPTLVMWSNDGRWLYFAENSKTRWDRSIAWYDRTAREKKTVLRGDKLYSGLRLSKDGSTAILGIADGKTRYGVVHLPTGYVKGRRYPTVFIIYENFFDDT